MRTAATNKTNGFLAQRNRLANPFLPADDEANVCGYWVPSPEEIAEQARLIREGQIVVSDGGCIEERVHE